MSSPASRVRSWVVGSRDGRQTFFSFSKHPGVLVSDANIQPQMPEPLKEPFRLQGSVKGIYRGPYTGSLRVPLRDPYGFL